MAATPRTRAKQEHARDLRLAGYTYQEIAEAGDPTADPRMPSRMYASSSAAHAAVRVAQERHGGGDTPSTVAERRALADGRYELLIQQWMPKALSGSEFAAQFVARLLAQQSDLAGTKLRPGSLPVETGRGEGDRVDDLSRRREERIARGADAADPASPG